MKFAPYCSLATPRHDRRFLFRLCCLTTIIVFLSITDYMCPRLLLVSSTVLRVMAGVPGVILFSQGPTLSRVGRTMRLTPFVPAKTPMTELLVDG